MSSVDNQNMKFKVFAWLNYIKPFIQRALLFVCIMHTCIFYRYKEKLGILSLSRDHRDKK